jgi:hypothetical protein
VVRGSPRRGRPRPGKAPTVGTMKIRFRLRPGTKATGTDALPMPMNLGGRAHPNITKASSVTRTVGVASLVDSRWAGNVRQKGTHGRRHYGSRSSESAVSSQEATAGSLRLSIVVTRGRVSRLM